MSWRSPWTAPTEYPASSPAPGAPAVRMLSPAAAIAPAAAARSRRKSLPRSNPSSTFQKPGAKPCCTMSSQVHPAATPRLATPSAAAASPATIACVASSYNRSCTCRHLPPDWTGSPLRSRPPPRPPSARPTACAIRAQGADGPAGVPRLPVVCAALDVHADEEPANDADGCTRYGDEEVLDVHPAPSETALADSCSPSCSPSSHFLTCMAALGAKQLRGSRRRRRIAGP